MLRKDVLPDARGVASLVTALTKPRNRPPKKTRKNSKNNKRKANATSSLIRRRAATNAASSVPKLDPDVWYDLKELLRKGDEFVELAFKYLSERLDASSSEARLLAVVLAAKIFSKSSHFRRLFVPFLPEFIKRCISSTLPPPKPWAVLLRTESLALVGRWNEAFGADFTELRLAEQYVSQMRVGGGGGIGRGTRAWTGSGSAAVVGTGAGTAPREARREREARHLSVLRIQWDEAKLQMPGGFADADVCLRELAAALRLLASVRSGGSSPRSHSSSPVPPSTSSRTEEGAFLPVHTPVPVIAQAADRAAESDILVEVRDRALHLRKQVLPKVERWLVLMARVDVVGSSNRGGDGDSDGDGDDARQGVEGGGDSTESKASGRGAAKKWGNKGKRENRKSSMSTRNTSRKVRGNDGGDQREPETVVLNRWLRQTLALKRQIKEMLAKCALFDANFVESK